MRFSDQALQVENWGHLHISLLWLYRGKVSAGSEGLHCTSLLSAWLILQGEATVCHDGRTVSAKADEWVFVRPGERQQRFAKGTALVSVRFRLEWPDSTPLFRDGLSLAVPARDHPDLQRRLVALERTVQRHSRMTYHDRRLAEHSLSLPAYLEVEMALFGWVSSLYEVLTSRGLVPCLRQFRDERIIEGLHILDDWPLHKRLSKDALYRRAGLNRSQFEACFREEMGQTSKQYFDRRRQRYAENALRSGFKRTKEISFELGFNHVSSFSAWFTSRTGLSPSSFRLLPVV